MSLLDPSNPFFMKSLMDLQKKSHQNYDYDDCSDHDDYSRGYEDGLDGDECSSSNYSSNYDSGYDDGCDDSSYDDGYGNDDSGNDGW